MISAYSRTNCPGTNKIVIPHIFERRKASALPRLVCTLALASLLSTTQLHAAPSEPDFFSLSPRAWAEDAAKNEIKVIEYGKSFLRYRIHTIDSKGNQLRDVIETRDGTVARLIAKEDRPLTSQEDADEHTRLKAMIDSPDAFARHIRGDASGKKLAVDLIRLMPQAMIYTYAPGQPQRSHPVTDGTPEIVLDFEPNPGWNPPSMTAQALTGLKGRIWIDARSHYMTRLEGTIFKQVNVGLGMVAHIYPGGQLSFEQAQVAPNRWIFSHFVEHVTVRALMFKTLKEDMDIQGSNFTEIAEMPYADAIRLLLASPVPTR